MRIINTILLFALVIILFSCQNENAETSQKERPHSPFVFRSVLDSNPRMVTFALSDEIWAAYRIQDCGLYKAWRGNVNFEGTVYNTHHGPQPTTIGNAYMENTVDKIWILKDANGIDMQADIEYKGHRLVGDGAELMYEMTARGLERPISIYERPEASLTDLNQPGF